MKHQLNQEQRLTWKMTQRLSQAIEMLAYNGQDLVRFLQDQAEVNPLIEVSVTSPIPKGGQSGSLEFVQSVQEKSFHDHLQDQLVESAIPSTLLPLVQYGIDSLNDHGYLDITVEEWSKVCGASLTETEEALSFIQSLHPAGVGARSLQECIAIQLKRDQHPMYMIQLVYDHIQWVADQDMESIQDEYGISMEEAKRAIEVIQTCHPRPGIQYSSVKEDYIVPDGEVLKVKGEWVVRLSPWNTPKVVVDEEMYALSNEHQEASAYLEEKYQHAKWLQMAIEQRKQNMKAIMEEIVKRQVPFFEYGAKEMQSLRMREVAEVSGVHVSTISRAVRHKYVQSPQGIVPLRDFFQQGLRMRNGQETSTEAIKHLLKETIRTENKQKPYSDQTLSQMLYDQFGIYISRRTVAKYRESLYIPSSTKRKKRG